jgi:hypothetical protein
MTDWLEVARRELAASADREEVSAVLAVGGGAPFEKIQEAQAEVSAVLAAGGTGSFRNSEEAQPRGRTLHDVEVLFGISGQTSPPGNDKKIEETPRGSVKTAETPFSAVLAVSESGALERMWGDDCSENKNWTINRPTPLPPGKSEKSPRRVLPKLSEPPQGLNDISSGPFETKTEKRPGEVLSKLPKPPREEGGVRSDITGLPLDAPRWRRLLEDKTIVVQRVRNLSQAEAERVALQIVLVEFLNATHSATDPTCCAWCGRPETPDATLLPIGGGDRHAWLHSDCWTPWCEWRRTEAIADLAAMGIVEPTSPIGASTLSLAGQAL